VQVWALWSSRELALHEVGANFGQKPALHEGTVSHTERNGKP